MRIARNTEHPMPHLRSGPPHAGLVGRPRAMKV